jgi:hypothetical protein
MYRLSTFGLTQKTFVIIAEVENSRRSFANWINRFCRRISPAIWRALNQATKERDSMQSKYNQLRSWSNTTNNATNFLQQVTQIDTSHYQATLLSNTVEQRSDLGGTLEQVITYAFTSSDSKLDVVFRFRNNQLSRYQIILLEGSPVYSQAQPFSVLVGAKGLLGTLATYEGTSYLANMSSLLSLITDSTQNIEIAEGNIKLNYTSIRR